MGKLIFLSLILFSLSGCFWTKDNIIVREVKVPVIITQPEPPIVIKPILPIHDLNAGNTSSTVFEAYVISVKLLENFAEELSEILDGYRKGSEKAD